MAASSSAASNSALTGLLLGTLSIVAWSMIQIRTKRNKKNSAAVRDEKFLTDHSDRVKDLVMNDVRRELMGRAVYSATSKSYPPVKVMPEDKTMRVLVTGGAGFVGSNLVDRLMLAGNHVIVVDNMFTGRQKNISQWIGHPNFQLIIHDVVQPIMLEVDEIYHLACPASPPHYQFNPIKTIKTSTMGTLNMLGLAKRCGARILLTSTSEIYGDPEVHPQTEEYWGNVNTIGPRACYDEGKRVAETMMYAYQTQAGVDIRVARIFNTFGPRMHPNDGRVVSNFIIQALQNKDLTVYGDGSQTRSFQYVDDLVSGLVKLMKSDYTQPVNIGNPEEFSILQFAELILKSTNSKSVVKWMDATTDDPKQRKPDISRALREIGWSPVVSVEDGVSKTIEYFRQQLSEAGEINPTGPDASKPQTKIRAPVNMSMASTSFEFGKDSPTKDEK